MTATLPHPSPAAHGTITPDQVRDALTLRDLSDPAQGPHAMQALLAEVVGALRGTWDVPALTHRPGPVVSVEDNYDRLGFTAADITRDARYSRYLSPTVMLRSHTSAAIPPLLRSLPGHVEDALHVLPGLVYRRDAIDATHVGEPHQVDLWRVAPGRRLGRADLESMAAAVVQAVLPGAEHRLVRSPHPYTLEGVQIDVRVGQDWLELAEAGLVAPWLLARAGLPQNAVSGLALGMGLDRALMLRKGIDDIRLLRSTHPRVAEQMLDLTPYRPVSRLPSITRDLSVLVGPGEDEETLGDAVRSALGEEASLLESVRVLATTPEERLPEAARARMRPEPGQLNVLLRVAIRPLEHTMTHAEANVLRDRIYLAVHRGPVAELIA